MAVDWTSRIALLILCTVCTADLEMGGLAREKLQLLSCRSRVWPIFGELFYSSRGYEECVALEAVVLWQVVMWLWVLLTLALVGLDWGNCIAKQILHSLN